MNAATASPPEAESPPELVVLVDEDGEPVGTAPKASVHTATTPRHLAFSCYVSDPSGRLLLTRRALAKAAWPGVWTNSVCGHPGPGEAPADAAVRRARTELGLDLAGLREVLPDFAYRAVDASGVVEHEVCPVFLATARTDPRPDPTEVAEWAWVEWADAVDVAARSPWALSPWAVLQLAQLAPLLSGLRAPAA